MHASGLRLFALGTPVAVALNLNYDRLSVMQKAIEQSGDHGAITGEGSGLVLEGDIAGEDDRAHSSRNRCLPWKGSTAQSIAQLDSTRNR